MNTQRIKLVTFVDSANAKSLSVKELYMATLSKNAGIEVLKRMILIEEIEI